MHVFDPTTDDINALDVLGISIKKIEINQRHVGILYREENQQTRMCHLAWHHALRDNPVPNDYHWVEVTLDEANKQIVVGYCLKIVEAKENSEIPYGLTYIGDYFNEDTGAYQKSSVGDGLTCATFIMAVFDPLGLSILNTESWRSRDEDVIWQRQIVDELKNTGASAEHIELVENDIGCARFRPEEIAASSTEENQPVDFARAVSLGEQLVAQI